MLIGREKEQAELLGLLEAEECQFCAVYGRRRVGKTYLIRETFHRQFAFQHTGLANATRKNQLKEFRASLVSCGGHAVKCPEDWYEAFHLLEGVLESQPSGKKVVFLDELSLMDTPKSNFVSALEHFWNGWATARKEQDIVLIVCGSATSWLIRKLVRDHGGLHNRLTRQIFLQPFTLRECKAYMEGKQLGFSDMDLAEAYMILGGIPYYWSFFQRGESFAQGIDRMIFAEGAPLAQEFQALYASLFRNCQSYIEVVTALANRKAGMTRREVIASTHLEDNSQATKVLEELEQCSFLRKYTAYGKKEREACYQLMDNYTLFYFRFIRQNTHQDEHFWTHHLGTPLHYAWAGLAFERLCLWHLPQIKSALGISGIITSAHSWRAEPSEEHEGAQVDLVIARNDRVIDLCEIKFSDGEYLLSKEEDLNLRRRQEVFRQVTGTRCAIHTILLSPFGTSGKSCSSVLQKEILLQQLLL